MLAGCDSCSAARRLDRSAPAPRRVLPPCPPLTRRCLPCPSSCPCPADLPQATLLDLLDTVRPSDLQPAAAGSAAALLVLAACARLDPSAPVVVACRAALRVGMPMLQLPELRLCEAGLERLPQGGDPALHAAVTARIAALEAAAAAPAPPPPAKAKAKGSKGRPKAAASPAASPA